MGAWATVLLAAAACAQSLSGSGPVPASAAASAPTPIAVQDTLARLDQLAQSAALEMASLRIGRWKMDSESREQAQTNADSVQRNLTSALPTLISAARSNPQNVNAIFKLYRNLNVLYEVMASLTEAAGATGPKQDFESLSGQTSTLEDARRNLADYLDSLTAQKEAELAKLHSSGSGAQTRPKKIIVDNEPATPSKKKRR